MIAPHWYHDMGRLDQPYLLIDKRTEGLFYEIGGQDRVGVHDHQIGVLFSGISLDQMIQVTRLGETMRVGPFSRPLMNLDIHVRITPFQLVHEAPQGFRTFRFR